MNHVARIQHVETVRRDRLAGVLAFTGRSIDDVVNSPIARRHVAGYYKLSRWLDREAESAGLAAQWDPLGLLRRKR